MQFVITAIDKPDGAALRAATRPAHFDYVLSAGNFVKLAGPYISADGRMVGSLLIVEAEDLAAVQAWAANDPYAKAGLFARSDIHLWKPTVNNCSAAF